MDRHRPRGLGGLGLCHRRPRGICSGRRAGPARLRDWRVQGLLQAGRDLEGVEMAQTEQVPLVEYHPKAPDASPERLRRLAGSIPFKGEVPSTKFLGEPEEAPPAKRARD